MPQGDLAVGDADGDQPRWASDLGVRPSDLQRHKNGTIMSCGGEANLPLSPLVTSCLPDDQRRRGRRRKYAMVLVLFDPLA
jgi:hypothetical protein